jgi:large subunit ribosomal protein L25
MPSSRSAGRHLNVKDLKLSDRIEVLTDAEKVVVTVVAPRVEEVAEPVVEATAEPEVIKKGKADEEEQT